MDATIRITVNGRAVAVTTDPQRPLLDVLREELGQTGTKYGCGEGQCGACSVIVDGRREFACSTPVGAADGKSIQTIEGLAAGDALHPVQEAFLAESAFQCGYCTAGMVMTAVVLLREKPAPSSAEIAAGMNGNICRCGGYPRILKAVRRAATDSTGVTR
jgi:aerobic-type carbon monoxide dehydrogenase small subunit (CoxS/CutS family)